MLCYQQNQKAAHTQPLFLRRGGGGGEAEGRNGGGSVHSSSITHPSFPVVIMCCNKAAAGEGHPETWEGCEYDVVADVNSRSEREGEERRKITRKGKKFRGLHQRHRESNDVDGTKGGRGYDGGGGKPSGREHSLQR